ncbi:MAG: hypothetical protein IPL49_15290 [Saprospirales bacterium]|nr:hypothetical protein [Saprospirales bacterium]
MKWDSFSIRFFVLAAVLMTLGMNCPPDGDPDPDPVNGRVAYINYDIEKPTTWTSDSIYVIYNCEVNSTLTIEAGTIIKFDIDGYPYLTIQDNGTLLARGSSAKPIVFTSFKDDANGGDTNKDNATNPGKGDWQGIILYGNGSELEYCRFQYGGESGSVVEIYDCAVTLKNCTFAHNTGENLSGGTGALDAHYALPGTVIQFNTFYDNLIPLSINTMFSIDDSNEFHNPGDPNEKNLYNGIYLYGYNYVETLIYWKETEVPFIIGHYAGVEETGTLVLSDNVVLKFMADAFMDLNLGSSSLSNNQGSGVIFTSIKDDSRKGDTNGDGNTTSPGNYDWEGIYNNASGAGYYFTWGNIYFDSY